MTHANVLAVALLAIGVSASGSQQPWTAAGPFGGPTEAIAALPEPGHFLAGSRDALLFHTSDAGDQWRAIRFPLALNAMLHALLAPAGSKRWFAGVSPETSGSSGLWISHDGGAAWRGVDAFRGRQVWALAAFPRDSSIVAAGANDGVFLSRDGGTTWSRLSPEGHPDLSPAVSLAFHPADPATLHAGTTHLPWRTTDGGASWHSTHQGMIDDSDVFAIHVDPRDPARVFASACSGMYRSADGGMAWTKLRGSPDASFRTYSIAQSLADPPALFAGTSHGLIRSADHGVTWRPVLPHPVKGLAFEGGAAGRVLVATAVGPHRSDDGGLTFRPAREGFAAAGIGWIGASRDGIHAAGANAAWPGVHRLDGAGAWTRVTTRPFAAFVTRGQTQYGISARGVFESLDGGKAWRPMPAPREPRSIAVQGGTVWLGAAGGLFRKAAGQTAWTNAVPGLAGHIVVHTDGVCAIARDAAAIRTASGWKMMRAPTPGAEWRQAAASGPVVLAATSHGLFRSADEGQTWSSAAGLAGQDTVTAVVFHPSRPEVAFAAQSGRVYVSRDRGLSWRPLGGAGLDGAFVRALAVTPARPDRLYALAAVRGIYMTSWENQP